ncbi:MAG: glycosyltransferase [Chlamydiae bacterium]|nr:glycosyltransferase [Chlamydiota bacterium]MBI3276219.1 glycosyltransferase [Chlamydiota bacterium]
MPPDVSINLCCYNSQKYLEETLQSVFSQTYKDWELVVINNGSTDRTEEIIQRHISQGWPVIYHYQQNQGLGKARHKAVELSSGRFIALIDHDDLWMPEKLERQMALFRERTELGLVYCDGTIIDGSGEINSRYSDLYPIERGNIFRKLMARCFIPPVSAILRREVFEKVGSFGAFKAAEEYDLFLKVAYQYEIDYVDDTLFKYRWHGGNLSQLMREELHLENIEIRRYWLGRVGDMRARCWIRREVSRAYSGYGSWLLEQGRKKEARGSLLRSFRFFPYQIGYLKYGLSWLSLPLARNSLKILRAFRAWLRKWIGVSHSVKMAMDE